MSLESSKQYDNKLHPRDLGDKSSERINKSSPHQAPQRERVSISTRVRRPGSAAPRSGGRRSPGKQRGWKDYIDPAINMGVPTLMMILEPNVVWGHSHAHSSSTGRGAEAAACQGYFFDGLDQISKLSHGVYEGSYWQLLGDLSELEDMLSRMIRAPALLVEPTLELPPQPELPKWEQFKPELQLLPEPPVGSAAPMLPDFIEPELPKTVDLPPPQLLPVPPLPAAWKEIVAPEFVPPPRPKPEPLQLPELVLPAAPVLKDPVRPASSGPPKYGHDWSGKRPFTVPTPSYTAPSLPPEPVEVPEELPTPELQEAHLELMPEPIAVLAWHGGPEDPLDDTQITMLGSTATSTAGSVAAGGGSQQASSSGSGAPASKKQLQALALEDIHDAWKEVQLTPQTSSGVPAVWLDFKAPFAEPPPVLLPPKPQPGPEPEYQPPTDLQELPAWKPPVPQPMPEYVEPPLNLPTWAAPCEPLPVGFLRGTAPVLIMDVSGTMHPARRGQFLRVKKCVCELLESDGELSTAGTAFDVLAFSGNCWSWSAAYAGKQALIASAMQGSYTSSRQAGGRQTGQLHTSPVSRSRPQWQRQQLQQQWQQQQQQRQQERPATASPRGRRYAGAEVDSRTGEQYDSTQDSSSAERPSTAAASNRPGTASAAAGSRPATADPATSSNARNRRFVTADSVTWRTQEPLSSPRQQLQQQQGQSYGPVLQPTDAEHLQEAKNWVQNWPEAVGNTNLLTALMTAHQYTYTDSGSRSPRSWAAAAAVGPNGERSSDSVDCYYLFSDGLADDAAACLDWVEQQAAAGSPIRPVHTVGFFPRNGSTAGERFLSNLAAATGGTFQVYNADLPVQAAAANIVRNATQGNPDAAAAGQPAAGVPKVWDNALGAFVAVDLANEDSATRAERRWAEEKLKQRRMENKRLGRIEPLNAMLEALRQQHQKERVMAAMEQHQQKLLQLKAAHTAACAAVAKANDMALRQAQRVHAVEVQQVQEENKRRVAAAHQAHEAAVQEWKQQYEAELQAWEQAVQEAKTVAAAATAAAEAQALGVAPQSVSGGAGTTAARESSQLTEGSVSSSGIRQAGDSTGSFLQIASELDGRSSHGRVSFCRDHSLVDRGETLAQDETVGLAAGSGIRDASFAGSAVGGEADDSQQQLMAELSVGGAATAAPAEESAAAEASQIDYDLAVEHQGSAESIDANPSAKLTFPLPSLPDSHSRKSLSSWGGTPRLPDAATAAAAQQAQRPHTAAGGSTRPASAAAKRPVSAGGALGARSQNTPATAGVGSVSGKAGHPSSTGSSRPKSGSVSTTTGATAAAVDAKPKANSRPKSATARVSSSASGSNVSKQKSKQRSASSRGFKEAAGVGNTEVEPQQHREQQQQQQQGDVDSSMRSRSATGGVSNQQAASHASEQDNLKAAVAAAAAAVEGIEDLSSNGNLSADAQSKGHSAGLQSSGYGTAASHPVSSSGSGQGFNGTPGEQQQQQLLSPEERLLNRIQSIEAANRQTLEHIYEDWHSQVVEVEQHNTSALQLHKQQSRIHAAKHAAYLSQREAWEREVEALQRRAKEQYEAAAAHAAAENARLARMHEQEVADKLVRDASFAQAVSDHAAAQSAAHKQHQVAVAAAKAAHAAAVAAAKDTWQQQQNELQHSHQMQLEAAQEQHTKLVQQIKEQNRVARDANKAASEAYRAATVENKRRLALYQEQQEAAAQQLAAANEAALRQARQDYKVLCAQLEELHRQQAAAAEAEWLAAKAAIQQRNDEAMAAARARYAAAVDEILQEHQAVCDQLKQQHKSELTRVRNRNDELMPQVMIAKLAAAELGRVKIFAAHMRTCASKLQLGVNFLADTPNLDRVVEMSALTDALKAAFPDIPEPREYPWPVQTFTPDQQQQEQECMPVHDQQERSTRSSREHLQTAAVPAAGSGAAMAWGRSRPGTAPSGTSRPALTSSLGSPGKLQGGSLGSWRAKSPATFDYKAAMQDPAVLLKRLQQSSPAAVPHAAEQQQQRPQTAHAHGLHVHRQRHGMLAHRPGAASSKRSAAPVVSSISHSLHVQRPQTAPAVAQLTLGRIIPGSSLGGSQQHLHQCPLEDNTVLGSSPSRGSIRRDRSDLPARHAVEHSMAGQRMAQVLVLHQQRYSNME